MNRIPNLPSTLYVATLLAASNLAHAAEPLVVGLGLDRTGPFSTTGASAAVRDGFVLAIEQLQGKLGGVPVKFVEVDTGGNPEQARQAVDRLIQRDKISLFTGPLGSSVALAVGPTLFAAKVPYVSNNAGPSAFAGAQCNRYFIAASYQNDQYHEAAGHLATQQGYKRTILITSNYPAGRDAVHGFKQGYKGEVADEIYVKLGQVDFSAELAQIRASKADSVYFFLGPQFIQQFVAAGLSKSMALIAAGFSADQDAILAAGDSLLGLQNAAGWSPDLPFPATRKFTADFRARFKVVPSLYAAYAYDTLMMMNAAATQLKGDVSDRDALVKALLSVKFDSVRGPFSFGNNQFPIQNFYVRVVGKADSGVLENRLAVQEPLLRAHGDSFAASCRLT